MEEDERRVEQLFKNAAALGIKVEVQNNSIRIAALLHQLTQVSQCSDDLWLSTSCVNASQMTSVLS